MASFGARLPRFAPIKEGADNSTLAYEKSVLIGRLIKADATPNFASGKLYADDQLAESVEEFVNATIAMETDDITDKVASVIYGATVKNKEVVYNADDTAPFGGLTYIKVLMRKGKKIFKGFYYPKVKAVLGSDSAQTKGDNITFGTSQTTFTVFQDDNSDWRFTHEFEKEVEAKKWCKEKLACKGKAPD